MLYLSGPAYKINSPKVSQLKQQEYTIGAITKRKKEQWQVE